MRHCNMVYGVVRHRKCDMPEVSVLIFATVEIFFSYIDLSQVLPQIFGNFCRRHVFLYILRLCAFNYNSYLTSLHIYEYYNTYFNNYVPVLRDNTSIFHQYFH